uniref:RING-type domain-containing protein n=1 Tax=Plectus sambesii TaxID=2011161 RepID=A0A914W605_9BILA
MDEKVISVLPRAGCRRRRRTKQRRAKQRRRRRAERPDQLNVRSVGRRPCPSAYLCPSIASRVSGGRRPQSAISTWVDSDHIDGGMRGLLVAVVVAVHRLATVVDAEAGDFDTLSCSGDQISFSGFVTQRNPSNRPSAEASKAPVNVIYLPSGALLQTVPAVCNDPNLRDGVVDSIDNKKTNFEIFTYYDPSVQCGPKSDNRNVYHRLASLFAGPKEMDTKIYFLIYDDQVQQRATANVYFGENESNANIEGRADNVYFFFLLRKPLEGALDPLLPTDANESRALSAGNQTVLNSYLANGAPCRLITRSAVNDNTDSDALRSFSKTSVLFVSVSFIILMVISLAWLVFYYVQRFRYAHAKDRLARRLFNAAKKALARIPTRPLRQGDKELEADCPVCIDPYRCGDIVRVLPCRHVFHKTCVDPWLLEHRTCPMCKSDILKAFGYNFGPMEDSRGQGAADDHASADGQSTDGSEGSAAESYSAYPFPLATDSDTHDPFSFTPTGSPQMVQQVLHSNNAQGFAIIPLTVHSATLQSTRASNSPGPNLRPASMGNLAGQRGSDGADSSLNDALPSVAAHSATAQHHSAQVHHPPVHSSSSSSCNAMVLSADSSSSSDETAADPFKIPLTKAMPPDAQGTHVTLSLTSPVGDRLTRNSKASATVRTTGPPVFDTGVSLSNSSFPLRKPSREVVNLVHVRSRSLTQDAAPVLGAGGGGDDDEDAVRPQFGTAASFDHGVADALERASSNASTSTRRTSAGRPATAATFRRKSTAAPKRPPDESASETKGKRNRRSQKYHSDENDAPDLGSLESL